jgi:hypothetical protein
VDVAGHETESNPADDRQDDRGKGARRRVKAEHVTIGSIVTVLATVLGGGGLLSSKVDTQGAALTVQVDKRFEELGKKFDDQGAKLTGMQLALTELKGQVTASDKTAERGAAELARFGLELRDLEKRVERGAARDEEHDRILKALQDAKK